MTEVSGQHVNRSTGCRQAARQLLEAYDPDIEDHVVIIPDLHYPYHASTGAVTHPETVAGIVEWASERVDRVELAAVATRWRDASTVHRYVGYDKALDGLEVDRFDPATARQITRSVSIAERETVVTVPEHWQDHVIVVPTLRAGEERSLVGTLDRLAATALGRDPTWDETIGYGAVLNPIGFLDAVYTFAGKPDRTGIMMAGDGATLDRIAGDLLGLSPGSIPARTLRPTSPDLRGIDLDAVRSRLPAGTDRSGSSPFMAAGYRAYAKISGDHVPPQILDD